MNTITTLIPQYGELNRISKDWIVSHTFSFEKQKFIVDFYSEWSDIKAFTGLIILCILQKMNLCPIISMRCLLL